MSDFDEARWDAVAKRCQPPVGAFVYAVRTTGVFCVPSCPSRRPLRKNVEFFSTAGEAIRAGYRACLRCRPERAPGADPAVAAVIAVCRWIEDPFDAAPIEELAKRVGWSSRHLSRRFTEVVGVSIPAYRRSRRAERVRSALRAGKPVTEAVFDAGFGSMQAFYDGAAPTLGVAPDAFGRGAPGETIRFALATTVLGVTLVAASRRGVCAVRLGDDAAALERELRAEFHRATVTRDEASLRGVVELIRDLAAGKEVDPQVPLDLHGTAFQTAVWEALRTVPRGAALAYSDLARMIGRPSAHRAAANACGANPVALLVPCHRVVRGDGSPGGYRWGEDRKRALLKAEAGAGAPGASRRSAPAVPDGSGLRWHADAAVDADGLGVHVAVGE